MATITMGLRRRVQVGGGGSSSSSVGQASGSSKRSRSENNNSPSQGNLNSPEPASKKSRGPSSSAGARTAAAKAKELELAKKASMTTPGPPHWSDPRPYASIAGLSLQAQAALCPDAVGLPSPMSYMSSQMATFVGNATNLGKSPSVSYLDISNMTARPPGWPTDDAKGPLGLPFAPFTTSKSQNKETQQLTEAQSSKPAQVTLPKNFPNDSMFSAYQPWVIKTYGDLAKTKTITIRKYARILRTLRGEEVNSAENSKFRFWVKSKGFHIGQPEGYEPKPADRIIGRHAVTNPGLDPPLYVPTQPPHNKALNGAEGTVPPGRVYKKVAIVENFFDIIHAVHVDLEGRPGKHAGQKRTYRTITETYAFLPREAVTRFLLGCTECQRRPRTPSPTSLTATPSPSSTPTATATAAVATSTPTPSTTTTASAPATGTAPPSPRPATTLTSGAALAQTGTERPREASHAPESDGPFVGGQQRPPPQQTNQSTAGTSTSTTTMTMTTTSSPSPSPPQLQQQQQPSSTIAPSVTFSMAPVETSISKPKIKDEKYNPLSITNLLRKDPITRRPPPPPPPPAAAPSALATLAAVSEAERNSPPTRMSPQPVRILAEEQRGCRSTPSPLASSVASHPRSWSPNVVEPKCTPIDYSLPIVTSAYSKHQQQHQHHQRPEILRESTKETSPEEESSSDSDSESERGFSPAAGLIDTNLNLLATIQQLHCQVMLALTERLRPPGTIPTPAHASGAHDAGPGLDS